MSKIIRDPIWGDIKLTDREADIVDDRLFQRLRGVKQLGLAYLVYPSATHSRYSHSIGTLAAAQRILSALKEAKETRVTPDIENDVRMVALLHDIGHVPFGHLLEDEAGLYGRHDDEERLKLLLPALQSRLPDSVESVFFKRLPKDHAYVEDIVSNTICSDLIDYLQRDGYFTAATGLRFTFDDRVLSFMRLEQDTAGSTRLTIVPQKDKIRLDVITDLLQLLRYRYMLTERVTYHHAKLAASAMLVKAVSSTELPSVDEMLGHSDDTFLSSLAHRQGKEGEVAARLGRALLERRLHKPVFRLTRSSLTARMSPEEFSSKYGHTAGRLELERQIVEEFSKLVRGKTLKDGDIVLYTSKDAKMTLKEVKVLVKWRSGPACQLRELEAEHYWESSVKSEVTALEQKYGALWTAGVFVDPSLRTHAYEIEKACARVFGVENDPLLQIALAQEQQYAGMQAFEPILEETGLTRTAAAISQRNPEGASLSPDEQKRRAMRAAMAQLSETGVEAKPKPDATASLEKFDDGSTKD